MRPSRPRSVVPISFDEFLDHKLEQARWRHDALVKLHRLYDLNSQSILMDDEMRKIEPFPNLTFNAPEIDRNDPLGLLRDRYPPTASPRGDGPDEP